MKRTTYLLKDLSGRVQARILEAEDHTVSLQPWMLHCVNQRGWSIESWETHDSGVETHGWADWQAVAARLAQVVEQVVSDERTEWSDEDGEALLEQAQAALDGYHLAEMEVGMTRVTTGGEDGEEEPDGGTGQ